MGAAAGLVLVTGPTGTVGGPLAKLLAARGAPLVAGALHPARFSGSAECRVLDFRRPETFAVALAGVRQVFLMRPPAISDTKRYLRPFLGEAERAGVQDVVFLSLMGVNPVMPHWQVEQDLRASHLRWTFLRPSFFAQNLQTAYLTDIRDHDQIRVASGRGRTSFIDTRNIAAVADLVLRDPAPHAGQALTLTGPDALTFELRRLAAIRGARPSRQLRTAHAARLPARATAAEAAGRLRQRRSAADQPCRPGGTCGQNYRHGGRTSRPATDSTRRLHPRSARLLGQPRPLTRRQLAPAARGATGTPTRTHGRRAGLVRRERC